MPKFFFIIKALTGGGAERVISLLANRFQAEGNDVQVIVTHQLTSEMYAEHFKEGMKIISLEEEVRNDDKLGFVLGVLDLCLRVCGKLYSLVVRKPWPWSFIWRYYVRNRKKIGYLKELYGKAPCVVIAFLNDPIYFSLLASGKQVKLIISERSDPEQCVGSRTNRAFYELMFHRADAMVFQSDSVQSWYGNLAPKKSRVIFNPVKSGLPLAEAVTRSRKIVNFCRINYHKNLMLLLSSFMKVHVAHPEYSLYIYGDPTSEDDWSYQKELQEAIRQSHASDFVRLLPAQLNIHEVIRDACMFVSSSDFEGMSNSMLESMAMGLPVVCTDCPAGGARAIIRDHVNGLLVPVCNEEALASAMLEVIEHPQLAESMSREALKLREELSEEKIIQQWMELIYG